MFNSTLLQEKRKEKGYTLVTLSEKIKKEFNIVVDPRTISTWENNKNAHPRKPALLVVCKVLDIQPTDLYIDEQKECHNDESILNIVEKIIFIYKKDSADYRIKQIRDILS